MGDRVDETWHRLLRWTAGQGASERLAMQVLLADGFTRPDPRHPQGGPDGKVDGITWRDGVRWVMAVYFPQTERGFTQLKAKFLHDLEGVEQEAAGGFAFVTNQPLSKSEREVLVAAAQVPCEIYHLERLVSLLDQPSMSEVRTQYLGVSATPFVPPDVRGLHGGEPDPSFVGRSGEIEEVLQFLSGDGLPVCVISGPPGAGKSALARRALAHAFASRSITGDGYDVDLRGHDPDPAREVAGHQALAGALRALGVEPARDGELSAQYHATLDAWAAESHRAVLLLDNVSSVAQVEALLPRGGVHRVVVTSRNDLAPAFANATGIRLGSLPGDDAAEVVRVVCRNARRLLQPEDEPGVSRLARLCGSLPLALRIATAILVADPGLSVQDLCEELDDEKERLATLEHGDLAVSTAFRASYVRLDEPDARCLRAVALHPGVEWSLAAAAALLGTDEKLARRCVRRLAARHLVEPAALPRRWRLHDLIRLFGVAAGEAEDAPGARMEAPRRVVRYYEENAYYATRWLVSLPDEGPFRHRAAALDWLELEAANLVGAVRLADQLGEHEAVWRLSSHLVPYLDLRRDHEELLVLLRMAGDSVTALGDEAALAGVYNNRGNILTTLGRFDDAAESYRRGIVLAARAGVPDEEAQLLIGLAAVRRLQNAPLDAIPFLERAAKIREGLGQVEELAYVYTNLGIALREAQAFAAAEVVLRQALPLHRVIGDRRAEASTLTHLATALAQQNRLEEAVPVFRASVEASTDVRDWPHVASTLMNLGNGYRIAGDNRAAVRAFEEALQALERQDEPSVRLALHVKMWSTCEDIGDMVLATSHRAMAERLRETWGDKTLSPYLRY